MGSILGKKSEQQTGEGQDWNTVVTNQNYQNLQNTIYTNTNVATNINTHENYGRPAKVNIKSETKNCVAVPIHFDVVLDSLRLIPKNEANLFSLDLKMNIKKECTLFLYWVSKVIVNQKINRILSITPKDNKDCRTFKLKPGEGQELPEEITISLNKYKIGELSESFPTVPLILVFKNNNPNPGKLALQSLTLYYQFDRRNKLKAEEISKVIEIDGRMSTLNNVYGMYKSKINKKLGDTEVELCLICYTNPINTMCTPCNHMCICDQCIDAMKKHTSICPMCREKIHKFIIINPTEK